MDGSVIQVFLSDILHAVSQSLLVPDILLLLAFIGYALFCIGSVLVEYFTERRHFKVTMPKFLAALMAAREDDIPAVIEQSGLLKRQKAALLTVYDYRTLPGDALVALIRRQVDQEETRYDRIAGRNNMAARVSPMLGLMGTLIPLGPGIQALGSADTELLSNSLLVAFDTTVAGLVVAAICMVIGKIRGNWYGNYMSALDSGMATMLQKIEDMRAAGKITIKEPSNYAFLYEQAHGLGGKGKKSPAPRPAQRPAEGAVPATQPARSQQTAATPAQKPAAGAAPQQDALLGQGGSRVRIEAALSSAVNVGTGAQAASPAPAAAGAAQPAPAQQATQAVRTAAAQATAQPAAGAAAQAAQTAQAAQAAQPIPLNFQLDPLPPFQLEFESPFAVAEAATAGSAGGARPATQAAQQPAQAQQAVATQQAQGVQQAQAGWYQAGAQPGARQQVQAQQVAQAQQAAKPAENPWGSKGTV